MRFYSDVTKKFYDTLEEAEKAEKQQLKADENFRQERKAASEKVDKALADYNEALKLYNEARKTYKDALTEFCNKYGTYHYTINNDKSYTDFFKLIDLF